MTEEDCFCQGKRKNRIKEKGVGCSGKAPLEGDYFGFL
jgi:hypothetical protein